MSFDLVAPWYPTLERIVFGKALQQCRVACLGEIPSPRRVLIVGEGNGTFLAELLRLHSEAEVDCLDSSARMLQLARKRADRLLPTEVGRVCFLHEDILSWVAPVCRYDLIVTNFFLDCFSMPTLMEVIAKLTGAAEVGATWLLADFRVPDDGVVRLRAQSLLAAMYQFFRVTAGIEGKELIDATPFLQAVGFLLAEQHLFRGGMLKSEIWRRTL